MIEGVRKRLNLFWNKIRPLTILLVGGFLVFGILRILDYSATNFDPSNEIASFWAIANTAVRVVGVLFILTWVLYLLDRRKKGQLKDKYALTPQSSPKPAHLFTHAFFHGDEDHLWGNTPHLLLFAGISALLVSSAQAFFMATVVILLVEGVGTWLFGPPKGHIGASGLLFGYYAFLLGICWFLAQIWSIIIIVAMLIFFGPMVYNNMVKKGSANTSLLMHRLGFIGGLVAAQVVHQL